MAASDRIKKVGDFLVITTDESPLVVQSISLNHCTYIDFYASVTFIGDEDPTDNLVLIQADSSYKLDFWRDSAISDGYGEVTELVSVAQGGLGIRCLVFRDSEACDYLRQILGGITI